MVQENYTALVGGMRQVQAVDLDLARAGVQVRRAGMKGVGRRLGKGGLRNEHEHLLGGCSEPPKLALICMHLRNVYGGVYYKLLVLLCLYSGRWGTAWSARIMAHPAAAGKSYSNLISSRI